MKLKREKIGKLLHDYDRTIQSIKSNYGVITELDVVSKENFKVLGEVRVFLLELLNSIDMDQEIDLHK